MSDLNIYVSTSNEHLHAIKPFQFLFNKFWGENQNVTILGYRPPDIELYNNFKFVSLRDVSTDKYGRLLANVYSTETGKSIGKELIDNRMAVEYNGGTKKTPDNWKTYYESKK